MDEVPSPNILGRTQSVEKHQESEQAHHRSVENPRAIRVRRSSDILSHRQTNTQLE